MFNAVLWIACSGAPWRDLPECFGSWKTVYSRFCKWCDEGTLQKVFEHLKKDADYENLSIDSTAVRAIRAAQAQKRGRKFKSKKHIGISSSIRTTKIHVVVDELGNPVYIKLTAGQIHDSTQAIEILSHLNIKGCNILADKAYGIQEIQKYIEKQGAKYTIPPKSNTKDKWERDYHAYKKRHVVECFFNKLKQYRRIATRYDKLVTSFMSFIYIGCIMLFIK